MPKVTGTYETIFIADLALGEEKRAILLQGFPVAQKVKHLLAV